jgi:hypothetical protein
MVQHEATGGRLSRVALSLRLCGVARFFAGGSLLLVRLGRVGSTKRLVRVALREAILHGLDTERGFAEGFHGDDGRFGRLDRRDARDSVLNR